MSHQPLDYRSGPEDAGEQIEKSAHIATAYIMLPVNAISVGVAVWFSVASWKGFLEYRGAWSFWPLFWISGCAGVLLFQAVFSVLPSWLTFRRRSTVSIRLRRAALISALIGILVTLGNTAVIVIYDALAP